MTPSQASSAGARGGGKRHAASALACTIVGVLPSALLGGLAPLIRADLNIPAWWIGVGVAIAFGTAALASVPGGRLADRLGSRRSLWIGVTLSAVSLFGIGFLVQDWLLLGVFLGLGGVSNAIIQPAANLALARGIPAGRRGLAFGLKQAAIPTAAALGGFAVPLVGVTFGWRAAFLGGGLLAVFAATLPGPAASSSTQPRGARPSFTVPPSLRLLTGGIGLASAAANAMAAYLVESATAAGWDAAAAGLFLGAGSVLGIVSRIVVGWLTDLMTSGWLRLVTAMMLVGAVGFGFLAFLEIPVFLAVGVALGFAAGWGHNGLFLYAVVRLHPEAPAAATGMTQVGAFGGPVVGPPLFGLIATTVSYSWAWGATALMSALAALFIHLARRQVLRERVR
ncbi:MFS transporter [Qaidamihabitans albus]|uniref:MFS transporter n=1 Tax=Qaidamihabitans albus TaxID=2795733 RepID=UPI001F3FCCB9|nr:MFS transporter [Qaidamihabitans albus]